MDLKDGRLTKTDGRVDEIVFALQDKKLKKLTKKAMSVFFFGLAVSVILAAPVAVALTFSAISLAWAIPAGIAAATSLGGFGVGIFSHLKRIKLTKAYIDSNPEIGEADKVDGTNQKTQNLSLNIEKCAKFSQKSEKMPNNNQYAETNDAVEMER